MKNRMSRRTLLGGMAAAAGAAAVGGVGVGGGPADRYVSTDVAAATTGSESGPYWPDGARLAVCPTMLLEADGGQDDAFVPGPEWSPQASEMFYNFYNITGRTYGAKEGMPRLLDMLDRVGVKGSCYMIGQSIGHFPDLAREVVARGHEAGGRPQQHRAQYHLSKEDERSVLQQGLDSYRDALDASPKGFNAWGLNGSVNTNDLLQELGYVYTIDDRSRDEPWIQTVNDDQELLIVPYAQHVNDLEFWEFIRRPAQDYADLMRAEFETLYAEGTNRRRMMTVSMHDSVSGHPAYMRYVENFLNWAADHEGVWFAKREEVAEWALGEGRPLTPTDAPFLPDPLPKP